MEKVFLLIAIVVVLLILIVFQSVIKIKRARQVGEKLTKRNFYYAIVAKLFVRDLPD